MIKRISSKSIHTVGFAGVIVFIAVFHAITYNGLDLFDDTDYLYYAWKFLHGQYAFYEDIFSHRLGIIVPSSLAFAVFGVNDFSSILTPLFCSFTTLFIIYFGLSRYKEEALIACILLTLTYYFLMFSAKPYPDMVVCVAGTASVFVLLKVRKERHKQIVQAFLFAGVVFTGILAKETIVYFFPFYGMVLIYDFYRKQNITFWVSSLSAGLVLSGLYLFIYYLYTSDIFYRWRMIEDGHYVASYSYFDKPWTALVPRLTYKPWLLFIGTEVVVLFILAIPALAHIDLKNLREVKTFFSLLGFVLLFMFIFSSTSLRAYNPIGLFTRMFLMGLPVWAIVASFGLKKALTSYRWQIIYMIGFAICAVISLASANWKLTVLYSLLTLVSGFALYVKRIRNQPLFLAGVVFTLLLHPAYVIIKADKANQEEKEALQTIVTPDQKKVLIICDPRLEHGYRFFYGFEHYDRHTYVKYDNLAELKDTAYQKIYVMVNKKTEFDFKSINKKFPGFTKVEPGWEVVYRTEQICLYKVNSIKEVLLKY